FDGGRRIEPETLRRLQGLVSQVNEPTVFRRYGHRCLEQGVLEIACVALEDYARLNGEPEALLESAESWLAAEEYERCLQLAQQVLQTQEEHLDALVLACGAAYALGDLGTLAVYGVRCLENRPSVMREAWVLGGLERLAAASGRVNEALRWARCLISNDEVLDASWLVIIHHSSVRAEVKQGLRYFLNHPEPDRDVRRLLESASTRFSHDVELARWVYETDPENERTQTLLLNCLLDEPVSSLRFDLHRARFDRQRGEVDLEFCLRCVSEAVVHLDTGLRFVQSLDATEKRRHKKALFSALRTIGAYGQLAGLIEEMLEHTSNSFETSELCRELALVRSSHLSDPEGAIDASIRLVRSGGKLTHVAPLVERIARETNAWGYLVEQASTLLVHNERLDAVELHRTLARWLVHVTNTELQQVAHLREARALGDQSLETANRMSVLAVRGSEEHLWALKLSLSHSVDVESRSVLLHQIAEWHELNDDKLSAIDTYRRVEREGVYTVDALESIARLGEDLGQDKVVTGTLTRLVADANVPDRWRKVCRLVDALLRVGEVETAVDRLWFEARRYGEKALRLLVHVAEKSGRWRTLESSLTALLQYEVDDLFEVREKLVALYTGELEDKNKAVRELKRLIQLAPERVDLLSSIIALTTGAVRRDHQWKLINLLGKDDPRRLANLRTLGREASPSLSRQCWLMVLEIEPSDAEALASADALAIDSSNDALFRHVTERIRTAQPMVAQQKLDWARLAINEPDLTEDAEFALRTLEIDPLVGTTARHVLLRWYEEQSSWEQAVEALERWILTAPSDLDELLVKRASYLEKYLDQPKQALESLLMSESPIHSEVMVAEIGRLAQKTDEWEPVLTKWDSWSDADAQCRFQAALWREYPIKDLVRAFDGFEATAQAGYRHVASITAMARVASGLGQGFVERTASTLSGLTDELSLSKVMHQIADYYLHQVASPEEALRWYDCVFQLTPDVEGV
ncbi:MAG: tetratricopeptide repeat protein, partial [Bradymonadia bacterium]